MRVVLLLFLVVVVKMELAFSQRGGSCPRQPFLVAPDRKCRKECDTNSDCRGKKKRCICDGVCGNSCFNPLANCMNLTSPANGSFEYTNGRQIWSSTATYKCDNGFALRGVGMRTCQSDRKWSGEEPFCSDLGVCGQSLNAAGVQQQISILTRVVGGKDADEGAWPWQVAILRESVDVFSTFRSGLFGGGSLINKHWILSAAHVIVELEKRRNYLDTTILALGYTELPSRNARASASGQLYRPRFVIIHPQYEQASLFDYDFALIRIGRKTSINNDVFRDFDVNTEGEVTYSDFIRPVCIPCTGTCVTPDELIGERGDRLLTGNETPEEACAIEGAWLSGRNNPKNEIETVVTGFGSTRQRDFGAIGINLGSTSNKLLQAMLTIEEDEDCQEAIKRVNEFQQKRFGVLALLIPFTKQMICATSKNSSAEIDACQGDSGGPLIREVKTNSNRTCWVQVGVVSFGFGCAWKQNDYSYPGFYSDVSTVSYWINSCKTRLTDAVRSDNLTCEIDVICRVLPIADGIDAQTESFPLLIEGFEVNAHTLVMFICIDNDLTIVGDNVVTCLPNGTFSGPYPTQCERRCHLSDLSDEIQIRTSQGVIPNVNANFRIGEHIVFSCTNPNRILMGQQDIQCREDGSWSAQFPTECSERLAVCYGSGDPHYSSFDGKKFDFQGNCSYVFVQNSNKAKETPSFVVEVDNENLGGNILVSWLRKVYVRIAGTTIELLKGGLVKIDEAPVNLPFESPSGLFRVQFYGRFVVIKTSFGLEVTHDRSYYISVGLSSTLFGTVEGLCGNFNEDPNDDFQLIGSSTITTSPTEFGNQFQTDTKKNCDAFAAPQVSPCSFAIRREFEASCSILNEGRGCFRDCLIDKGPYFNDCVFDACTFGDARVSLENNVGAYVKACHDNGYPVCSTWRQDSNIPLDCKPNSTYSVCASRCPKTCIMNENVACDQLCVEGCECDEGHVLSGDQCVLLENCGCQYKGQYYQPRQRFYDDDKCTSICTCTDGLVACREAPCKTGQRCGRDEKGNRDCIPIGDATCIAWGDPHYRTFDGNAVFDFMGFCTYTLVQTIGISPNNARWFSINSTNEPRNGNNQVSYLQSIGVSFRRGINVVLLNNGSILYNGEEIQGYDRSFLKVQPSGRSIRLSTSHGLTVLFNSNEVRITLPSTYAEKVRGICGNYNGDSTDELQAADGRTTNNFNTVALSYEVESCDDRRAFVPFICPPNETEVWERRDRCGALTRTRGTFRSCHNTVNPRPFFEKCVFDGCASGDRNALGEGLQTYAQECLIRGIQLCNWRNATGTDIPCPPNSRYVGCASPCPDTCSSPFASSSCAVGGFVEDCVCNFGYIRDGERCVRQSECGTTEDGIYKTISCGFPDFLAVVPYLNHSGVANLNYIFGDVIHVRCIQWYEMTHGSAEWRCSEDAEWIATDPGSDASLVPVCSPTISCGFPDFLAAVPYSNHSGVANLNYTFGDVIHVRCIQWYEMTHGSAEWRCSKDAEWISTDPGSDASLVPVCSPICGNKNGDNRPFLGVPIAGGEPSNPNEWPWIVFINIGILARVSAFTGTCGGTLISPSYVLTSARCVTNDVIDFPPDGHVPSDYVHVWIGVHDRRPFLPFTTVRLVRVERVIRHPEYNIRLLDSDVALLRLAETVIMNDVYRPICLPNTTDEFDLMVLGNTTGEVAGWGLSSGSRRPSHTLRHTEFPTVTSETCLAGYLEVARELNITQRGINLTENMFCVRQSDSICVGDSGAPYMVKDTSTEKYYSFGIASFGTSFRYCGEFVTYTTFAYLRPNIIRWLNENMN